MALVVSGAQKGCKKDPKRQPSDTMETGFWRPWGTLPLTCSTILRLSWSPRSGFERTLKSAGQILGAELKAFSLHQLPHGFWLRLDHQNPCTQISWQGWDNVYLT